jgi:hypothetical protein
MPMSNDNGPGSTLDGAIDHAVREMMQVDPRPGLRQRVLNRLNEPARPGRWIGVGALAAAATLLLTFVTTMDRSPEVQPVPPGQVAVQPSAEPGALPPGPQAADDGRDKTPAPVVETARGAEPAPESIFGPRSNQVRGASVPRGVSSAAGTQTPARASNLTLVVTITDQRDGVTTAPKTVSMVVTDRQWGRLRSKGDETLLNVDARPEVLPDGRIRVGLTIEYRAAREAADKHPIPTMTKTLSAIVENGKTLTLSESTDPASHRTVKVDVKATLLQ